MLSGSHRRRGPSVKLIALPIMLLMGVAAILLDTRFVPKDRARASSGLDVDKFVATNLPQVTAYVSGHARPLGDVVKAISAEPDMAKSFGVPSGTGRFAIPVAFSGMVKAVGDGTVVVAVDGLPSPGTVLVALGATVSGAALRDVTGKYTFTAFESQSEYQRVANRFRSALLQELTSSQPAVGNSVVVEGVLLTGVDAAVTPTTLKIAR